jgi:hypothetical protein
MITQAIVSYQSLPTAMRNYPSSSAPANALKTTGKNCWHKIAKPLSQAAASSFSSPIPLSVSNLEFKI